MSGDDDKLPKAELDWSAGAPRSTFFDDIYFSGEGFAESRHVFVEGAGLPQRFGHAVSTTVGELGFGTGLNFLLTWRAFLDAARPAGATLDFVSVEKFPLAQADLEKAHATWPALADLSALLRAATPPRQRGLHQIHFGDGVTLTLIYDGAAPALTDFDAAFDAWFLDGFAPSRNEDMWSPALMRAIARLTKPGGAFATFTVAGAVRRALASAGFGFERREGFGRKREMLRGRLIEQPPKKTKAPWFARAVHRRLTSGARIALIGGGIAGATLAAALSRKGYAPTIIDSGGLAAGASGNPGGLIMPRIDLGDSSSAAFFLDAYAHTVRLLKQTCPDTFNACGVLVKALDGEMAARHGKIMASRRVADGWIEQRGDDLFFPQAGVVDPGRFVATLTTDAEILVDQVVAVKTDASGATLNFANGPRRQFDAAIICNSVDARRLQQTRTLPLLPVAGQLDWFPDASTPDCAIAAGPYLAPAPAGGVIVGATYNALNLGESASVSASATQFNIDAARRLGCAGELNAAASRPRVAIRCQTPDRLPIAGPMPDFDSFGAAYDGLRVGAALDYSPAQYVPRLWIMTGLGSRGLVTAPFLAEMIAADIAGAPAPTRRSVIEALHPGRFFIRSLRKAQIVRS